MLVRSGLALVLGLALLVCAPQSRADAGIVTETFMIPALDPGIQLHVRNKHLGNQRGYGADNIILFVHGATYPSETGFDLDVPGGSWLEYVAYRNFDVYAVDIRGYGRSTRPAAMDQPPGANPPFSTTREAIRDVSAAVDFILKRRGVSKINLLGWSWGTTIMGGYAAENPEKVQRLVLYAPVWTPVREITFEGAYRLVNRDAARVQSIRGIPPDRVEDVSPTAWFDKWWAANLATDPQSSSHNPPALRAPNGVMHDLKNFWGAGKPTYDPAAIRAPTLVIVGEWDGITPPSMAQDLFGQLTGAKNRRLVLLSEGSHAMALEKNRMHLIREVQHFLEEPVE